MLRLLTVFVFSALLAAPQTARAPKARSSAKSAQGCCAMCNTAGAKSGAKPGAMSGAMPGGMSCCSDMQGAVSADQVTRVLADKKSDLGLSDEQVSKIADLLAAPAMNGGGCCQKPHAGH